MNIQCDPSEGDSPGLLRSEGEGQDRVGVCCHGENNTGGEGVELRVCGFLVPDPRRDRAVASSRTKRLSVAQRQNQEVLM